MVSRVPSAHIGSLATGHGLDTILMILTATFFQGSFFQGSVVKGFRRKIPNLPRGVRISVVTYADGDCAVVGPVQRARERVVFSTDGRVTFHSANGYDSIELRPVDVGS